MSIITFGISVFVINYLGFYLMISLKTKFIFRFFIYFLFLLVISSLYLLLMLTDVLTKENADALNLLLLVNFVSCPFVYRIFYRKFKLK